MRLPVLDKLGIPYDPQRVDILIAGLKRRPGFEAKLEAYKRQTGGADPDLSTMGLSDIPIPKKVIPGDFLGTEARWFVNVIGSPYAQVIVRVLFTVLFFLSYVESIPMIGAVISGALDILLAGGRILIKTVQKMIPVTLGLIPLPFTSVIGLVMAATFGMILWPLLAIVSFSRQDFTSAIESFVRAIPPPLGDTLADAFLDANRTVSKLNERRKEVVEQILDGLRAIQGMGTQLSSQVQSGTKVLTDQLQQVRQMVPALPTQASAPAPAPVPEPAPAPAPAPAPEPAPAPTPASKISSGIAARQAAFSKGSAPTPASQAKILGRNASSLKLGGTRRRHRFSRTRRRHHTWRTSRRTK